MSNQITTAFVQQFKENVLLQFQQRGSKLRGSIQERAVTGNVDYWDMIGSTTAVQKVARGADTQLVNTPHARRAVILSDYEWADLVDKQDEVRLLIDPKSAYAQNAALAIGRAFDTVAIAAFDGAALDGQTGSTTIAFGSDSAAGDEDFSGAALTLQNIVKIKQDLDNNDVPEDGRHILLPPSGFNQLLKQTGAGTPTVTNADYMAIKALVNGDINSVAGFTFHRSTLCPNGASSQDGLSGSNRYGFAWHESAMAISVGMDMVSRITERPDKSYSTQVYAALSMGAVRLQGKGIVRIKLSDAN